jgi:hypothetical protein
VVKTGECFKGISADGFAWSMEADAVLSCGVFGPKSSVAGCSRLRSEFFFGCVGCSLRVTLFFLTAGPITKPHSMTLMPFGGSSHRVNFFGPLTQTRVVKSIFFSTPINFLSTDRDLLLMPCLGAAIFTWNCVKFQKKTSTRSKPRREKLIVEEEV